MRKTMLELHMALFKIQETIHHRSKQKTDLYYQDGKGVLVVGLGKPLIEANVLYKVEDTILHSQHVTITRVIR